MTTPCRQRLKRALQAAAARDTSRPPTTIRCGAYFRLDYIDELESRTCRTGGWGIDPPPSGTTYSYAGLPLVVDDNLAPDDFELDYG